MSDFIISRTPLRISFAGGGTDLASAVNAMQEPGLVLNMAVNKYVYITIKKHSDLFQEKYRLNYSQNELINSREEIKNKIIKESLEFLGIDDNLYISTVSDIPAGTGLGSSSAFTIGLLNALHSYKKDLNITQERLANEAIEIETNRVKSPIGAQDQFGCAFGGLKFLKIHSDLSVEILNHEKENEKLSYLTQKIILIWTGGTRLANEILKKQDVRNKINREILLKLKIDAQNAYEFTKDQDLYSLAKLIDSSWERKKSLTCQISNSNVDNIINQLTKLGIKGCKLLGAGSGGFVMGFNFNDYDITTMNLKKILKVKPDLEGSILLYKN